MKRGRKEKKTMKRDKRKRNEWKKVGKGRRKKENGVPWIPVFIGVAIYSPALLAS